LPALRKLGNGKAVLRKRKKDCKNPEKALAEPLRKLERQERPFGKRGQKMNAATKDIASLADRTDEELIDTLIAISVVAKRLADNLRQQIQTKETKEHE
jgi:hypothetical protein